MNLTDRAALRQRMEALRVHLASEYTSDLRSLLDCADDAYELAPFKEGDRVRLAETVEITGEKSHGWLGAKHFLVAGARAIVRDVSLYGGSYSYGVSFPEESWISRYGPKEEEGKIHAMPQTHTYSFQAKRLEPWGCEAEWPADPDWCDCDDCQRAKESYERED